MCPIETEETSELLLQYCAGRLDAETARILERHIGECAACRRMFEEQQQVWRALDDWEALPVTADFDRRLYGRIDREGVQPWWRRLSTPLRPLVAHRGLAVAAAACLMLAAGLMVRHPELPAAVSGEARAEAVQADQVEKTLQDMELLYSLHMEAAGSTQSSAM